MKVDRASAALALLAGFTAVRALQKKDARSAGLAATALLAFLGYDRAHDGLWPFTFQRSPMLFGVNSRMRSHAGAHAGRIVKRRYSSNRSAP